MKNKIMWKIQQTQHITSLVGCLMIAGCSQTPYSPEKMEQTLEDMELERGRTVETIHYRDMEDWVYLDKYHIIFKTKRNGNYLISFQDTCYGLSDDAQLILESTTGTLSKFDDILINHRIAGIEDVEYCAIQDIVQLETHDNFVVEEP